MGRVIPARRRWLAGALLIGVGWLASPGAIPVYDGIGAPPDEPYRYVAPPPGAPKTAPATSLSTKAAVVAGANAQGLSVQTSETGPQMSVFVPQGSMAASTGPITISITPTAPTDAPKGARVDGNVYVVALTAPGGPVTLVPAKAFNSTMYLRATDQRSPQPTMFFRRDPASSWEAVSTSAAGLDVRVGPFRGAGQYVLAWTAAAAAKKSGGAPVLPLVLVGTLVLLLAIVLVVRLRAARE